MVDAQPSNHRPRIALAHDWLVACRGGEAVLAGIAAAVAERASIAGLYTMVSAGSDFTRRCTGRYAPLATLGPVRTSFLQHLPGAAGPLRRWMLPLFPAAVTDLSRRLALDHAREPIDLLISTSSAAIKGLRPPPGVPHLCYCHAPARYLWSQAEEYARGRAGGLRALGLKAFGRRLRSWDRRTAANVGTFLANSSYISAEVQRCYGRSSEVVFPPVDTGFYTPKPGTPRSDHWLYAGALEPYKRVDVLIAAAALAGRPLVVVGEGSQARALRALAGPGVTFKGRVSDEELRREYRSARLLAFPQVEDFGIVAVEAQACGTPVLAFGAGGALDTVIEGQTGVFFREASPTALVAGAKAVPPCTGAVSAACRTNAERFSEDRFRSAIRRRIDLVLQTPPAAAARSAASFSSGAPSPPASIPPSDPV